MENTHTPGPWNLDQCSDKYCRIYSGDSHQEIAEVNTDDNPDGEANARLISLAPDMLEALEGQLYVLRVTSDYFKVNQHEERQKQIDKAYSKIELLIAKIKG